MRGRPRYGGAHTGHDLAHGRLCGRVDTSPPEFRAAAELDAAQAHLALGDAEATYHRIKCVLELPVELLTAPIVGRVVTARTELRALATRIPVARDMTQQIDHLTTYTAEL
ncbi:hypothetical protein ACFU44_03895 [Nocardia rhizosphaerihabitans]|uniref:hypothetical protein n=1 Tax=Nocardia rhizosphaerihabitans TaxID=1691570 RepID=UPI00366B2321